MKNKVYLLIIITIFAAFSCAQLNNPFLETDLIEHDEFIDAQRPETRGKEFYLAFTEQYIESSNPVSLSVFITGINAASGNVYIYGLDLNIPFTVAKDEIKKISIPYETTVISNDTIENYGIYIQTDSPVTVTGLNQELYTTDSFLVYPVQSLGLEHYKMAYKSYNATFNGSNFVIVTTQNDTSISITPTITSGSRTAETTYNINLNKYQSYRLAVLSAEADITGSHIISDKPIAVFSGNRIASIPNNINTGDHLYDQVISVDYWSDSYAALPLASRDRYTIRIMSSQKNTDVNING